MQNFTNKNIQFNYTRGKMYQNTSNEEYIEIVEWLDNTPDTLAHRFERRRNRAIKNGAQLIVRESQVAVMINDGIIGNVFEPGHYELQPPSKCEIYFVSTKVFTSIKWNASANIPIYDAGVNRNTIVHANGTYSLQVDDATKLLQKLSGTMSDYKTGHITFELSKIIAAKFATTLCNRGTIPLDYTSKLKEISLDVEKLVGTESYYGLKINKLLINNINLPFDLCKKIDAGIGIIIGTNIKH